MRDCGSYFRMHIIQWVRDKKNKFRRLSAIGEILDSIGESKIEHVVTRATDSSKIKALALHLVNLGLILSTAYGPLSPQEVIPEQLVKSKLREHHWCGPNLSILPLSPTSKKKRIEVPKM